MTNPGEFSILSQKKVQLNDLVSLLLFAGRCALSSVNVITNFLRAVIPVGLEVILKPLVYKNWRKMDGGKLVSNSCNPWTVAGTYLPFV